jgi:hypothetical protein
MRSSTGNGSSVRTKVGEVTNAFMDTVKIGQIERLLAVDAEAAAWASQSAMMGAGRSNCARTFRRDLVRKRTKERIERLNTFMFVIALSSLGDDTVGPRQQGFDFGASKVLFPPGRLARPTTFMVTDGDEPWNQAESR